MNARTLVCGAARIDRFVETVAVQHQQRHADRLKLAAEALGEATVGHRTSAKHVVIQQEAGDLGLAGVVPDLVRPQLGIEKANRQQLPRRLR